ncbi:MAG: glycosyltransferase family 39 protein [Pyrinomonadaceae bacterium]
MSAPAATIITAGLRPELFVAPGARHLSRALLVVILTTVVFAGFGLRAYQLGAESLGEDEFNKLNTVADYRAHGLTASNGEHPFLMKALQTASIVVAQRWNAMPLAARSDRLRLSPEAALRLPSAIFGALTAVLIYLLAAELFGAEVALIAAALWAVDPNAVGFNRIAKEDTFFLFFFLLANIFWLRGQRAAEGTAGENPKPYYWATGAAFGAMLASKYLPHFIVVSVSYNYIFQGLPNRRWRIGRPRYAVILTVMGMVFLLCNPTILLPGTWREMMAFAGSQKIGHDSYEFMGMLYRHKFTDWLNGVPWYFYFVFMGVKLPPLVLAAFVVGLPLLFRRRIGDGRYFLLFWMFYWAIAFIFPGGKFTRYFTLVLPAVLITAAGAIHWGGQWLGRLTSPLSGRTGGRVFVRAALALFIMGVSTLAAVSAAPHYRLYTNLLGGGAARAGDYFPHDEFYDASLHQVMSEIARRAAPGARVASETPSLVAYYARRAGRADLAFASLSDRVALDKFVAGDFLIAARGRRYFSNDALLAKLRQSVAPDFRVSLGEVPAVDVYILK